MLRLFEECFQQMSIVLVGFKLQSSYLGRRESIDIASDVTTCDHFWPQKFIQCSYVIAFRDRMYICLFDYLTVFGYFVLHLVWLKAVML